MSAPGVPHVVLEAGALARLPEELEALGFRRPFIVSTRGRFKLVGDLAALLGESLSGSFSGAEEHGPVAVTDAAEAVVRTTDADVIVAVGGGSPIGLGKALVLRSSMPLAVVPTTYSGSEMTSIYGITDATGKKTGRDPRVRPQLVIYDPLLTLDLSAEVSAASGMNALAHSVEAAYAANATTTTSQWAQISIQLLLENLPRVVADPSSVTVRTEILFGSHLAGRALDSTSMGLHHRICHVLGGSFGLPHAGTHAVLLPIVAEFNGSEFLAQINKVVQNLPVPRSLRALGFPPTSIDAAATEIAASQYPNPRPVVRSDIVEILEKALDGK